MLLPQATIDALIAQCRGEIAAVDAYDRALKKFAGQPEESTLLEIRNEHDDSVARLRAVIERDGGKIPHEGGAWGGLANAVQILAINAGRHVNPLFAGLTVYAWSEVLEKADLPGRTDIGALLFDGLALSYIPGLYGQTGEALTAVATMLLVAFAAIGISGHFMGALKASTV